jgi:hypothetical protein
MAEESVMPLAVVLSPSSLPYQFTELVNPRGDFDAVVQPGEAVNPKGIAYHPALDALLVSLSPYRIASDRRVQILNRVTRDGERARFASDYTMYRAVESKLAIAPHNDHVIAAGFTPGEIFVGRGPLTQISRLSANGEILDDVFAEFGNGSLWGALAFDTEGAFGGQLIAVESNGALMLVDGQGQLTPLGNLGMRLEGATVAPATFGPLARQLIVGVEGYGDQDPHGGKIFAVNAEGATTLLANIGFAAEDLNFVPPRGGTYYQAQLSFERERDNRILSVTASQFLNRLGRLVIVNELTGELHEVAWDGARYTQQQVARVPGRWTSAGFNIQGTELEQACFAVSEPVLPDWQNWDFVPGNVTTDKAPAATADIYGDVVLMTVNPHGPNGRGVNAKRLRRRDDPDGQWDDWREPVTPLERLVTPHALACCQHNALVYGFGVRNDGRIACRVFSDIYNEYTQEPWRDVPGMFLTNTGVSSTVVNGRLVLCALGQDQGIYLNELAPGGRTWSGWYQVPGGGHTNVTPTVASFQDELYVFIKGLSSRRILVKVRSVDGYWQPWAEVPGAGRTDDSITAVAAHQQLYVFSKVPGSNAPQVNAVSKTGTWSGWVVMPNSGATDRAMAAANVGGRVYLFAKGIDNPALFVRSTI